MDEIAIKIEESEGSEDLSREEEKWTTKHEGLLAVLKEKCLLSSAKHKLASGRSMWFYQACILPNLTLPMLAAFLEVYTSAPQWVAAGLILASTGIGAVNGFLNFGKRSAQHGEFAGRYEDLDEQISLTLARRKRSREACDVAMTKYLHRHGLLNASAPSL